MPLEQSDQFIEALKRCENEPIQFIASIQNDGVLLAVDASAVVCTASANLSDVFEVDALQALGRKIGQVIGHAAWQVITALGPLAQHQPPVPLILPIVRDSKTGEQQAFVHQAGPYLVIEVEGHAHSHATRQIQFDATARVLSALLSDTPDIPTYADQLAHQVRSLTNFDRVMVYQFDHQWNGVVIAESSDHRLGMFLGHHFPASDIPEPARRLYAKNLVRMLADRATPSVPLLQFQGSETPTLDLSFSVLRSMSPVHLIYLKNMDVTATAAVSLLQHGRLWGLVVCHHRTPKRLPLMLRDSLELIARTAAIRLSALAFDDNLRSQSRLRSVHLDLQRWTKNSPSVSTLTPSLLKQMMALVQATGLVIIAQRQSVCFGQTPPMPELAQLQCWLTQNDISKQSFSSCNLAAQFAPAQAYADIGAGLLAISLDEPGTQVALWFRAEVVRAIAWAGDAQKVVTHDAQGPKLEPRSSFERWVQTRRGESEPWGAQQVDAANTLSMTLRQMLSRQRLQQSEQRYRSLVDWSPQALVLHRDDQILYVNPAAIKLFGASSEQELLGQSMLARIHSDYQLMLSHGPALIERILQLDGSVFDVEVKGMIVNFDGLAAHQLALRDITQAKRAQAKIMQAASVFTYAREGILITDAQGSILDVNDTFTSITGYARDEVLGQNPRLLKSGRQGPEFYVQMWRALIDLGHWQGEIWNTNKNGVIYPQILTVSAVRDTSGVTLHYVGLFTDISAIKAHEVELERAAHYDALTGLPNRVLLADRLGQAMAHAQRHGQRLAVVYLDLDEFKTINDKYGHAVGDQLLKTVGQRIKQTLREGDTLAHLGGDEFVVVLNDLKDISASQSMLIRLLVATADSVQVDDHVLHTSASLGVSFFPQAQTADADLLLRQADQAMYQAKQAGKNRYHVFDAELDRSVRDHHERLLRLTAALEQREFVLYYQPKVNMRTGQIIGAEALIRWQHPEQGLLPPAAFLPEMEDHPLAIEVGEWVIDSALTQLGLWQAQGLNLMVSVNVGALQLQQVNFVDRLRQILARHPEVDASGLEIEVLETSALQDLERVTQVMQACRQFGVSFALDDFGTGYSSLTYLKRLPVKVLKIDQSFVRDMLDDPDDLSILQGILGLAVAFHREAIAEGVETVAHGAALLRLGCDLAQGYGIARPMPAANFPAWVSVWQIDPSWRNLPDTGPVHASELNQC
jgi:diguanylate cyclase (GGDEF)-like protein/PAS domain S-box-containing protein